MRLKSKAGNVIRIATDPDKIKCLKALGYTEIKEPKENKTGKEPKEKA